MEQREGYAPGWGPGALSMMERRTAEVRAGFALPFLADASRVVDVGCGPGSITVGLAQAAPTARILGVDREASQVESAREAATAGGVSNVEFEQGSAYDLPVPEDGVDVVFSHAVLEHLVDPAAALAECARVLRPGGVLAVCCSDWGRAELDPFDADVKDALAGHYLLRRRAGGDPFRGRVLPRLVTDAGFTDVDTSRADRVDMAYHDYADWVRSRIQAALVGPELSPANRETLQHADRAAGRWATRRGRFTQCWIEVTARRPDGGRAAETR